MADSGRGIEWIIYTRISDDREGRGLGVKRQEMLCRELHRRAELGGIILAVCCDNDLSAYDASGKYKPRPEYGRMVELLRQRPGKRGVLAYHTDRLHRTPRELEDFIEVVEATGADVRTVKAGIIDLSTASGRMTARVHCAVARHESEHRSERIRAKTAELAASGSIYGGGPRPFGYTRVFHGDGPRRKILRDEINEEEAAIVRECARRVLAGDTLRSVVNWLNRESIPTSTGGPWSKQGMRHMLRSGRIAGLREHRRQVVGKAVWDPIITVEEHEQLRALLDARHRPEGSRVRVHWLSGFVFCSSCADKGGGRGVKMRVSRRHGVQVFYCPPDDGCNGRVVKKAPLEALIEAELFDTMRDPRVLAEIAARQSDTAEMSATLLKRIDGDERRLALLQDSLDDSDEDELPEVVASVKRLRARVRDARAQLAGLSAEPGVRHAGTDLEERWEELDLDQRQSVLRLVIKRILIGPGVRGRPGFDPERVEIERPEGWVAR